jgi:hypothetical protein
MLMKKTFSGFSLKTNNNNIQKIKHHYPKVSHFVMNKQNVI